MHASFIDAVCVNGFYDFVFSGALQVPLTALS